MERRFRKGLDQQQSDDLDVLIEEAGRIVRMAASVPEAQRLRRIDDAARAAEGRPAFRAAIGRLNATPMATSADAGFDVGALLDDEVRNRKVRPVKVELWATKIRCIRDFDREWGKDEILIGAVSQDTYSGQDWFAPPLKIGEFGKKDRNGPPRDIADVKLAEFPVGPGLWRDSMYATTVYLGERDLGGMKRFMEMDGVSSRQFIQLQAALYLFSITSLLGLSVAAESGLDAKGIAKGVAVGLGPLLWRSKMGLPVRPIRKIVSIALLEAAVNEIVHAVADDMFPPQVLGFHLLVPPGASLADLDHEETRTFEYTQESVGKGTVVVSYETTFQWRVRVEPANDVDYTLPPPTEAPANSAKALANLDKIEHIVVVMLENRSFDLMLGFLTAQRGRQGFLNPLDESMFNELLPSDFDAKVKAGLLTAAKPIHARALPGTALHEDPNHFTQAVARQVFGAILPDQVFEIPADVKPRTPEPKPAFVPAAQDPHWPTEIERKSMADAIGSTFLKDPMKGFVRDYFTYLNAVGNLPHQKRGDDGRASDVDAVETMVGQIMGYHTAEQLPAYDLFATEFAVCDRWFSAFPGNTWVNRTIALTGRPGRRMQPEDPISPHAGDHVDHARWIVDNKMPLDEVSFFRKLDECRYKGTQIEWAFYAQDVPSLLLVDSSYASELRNRGAGHGDRLRMVGRFFRDAEKGNLPHVSWIDPNFMDVGEMRDNVFGWDPGKDTDNYFAGHLYDLDKANDDHPPTDCAHAQSFVLAVYNALLASPQWEKTMLIVTYDEHGGFHDHVPPPATPSAPESPAFTSLGVRVPAMVISPWVGRQLVSNTQFDHTSIIKTIFTKFCRRADGSLPAVGARVDAANHLGGLLDADTPRFVRDSARGASMRSFVEGLASVMKIRRTTDRDEVRRKPRKPNDLQRQMREGRSRVLGRVFRKVAGKPG